MRMLEAELRRGGEKSFTIKGFLDNCYFQSLVFHTYRSAAVELGDALTLLSVSY